MANRKQPQSPEPQKEGQVTLMPEQPLRGSVDNHFAPEVRVTDPDGNSFNHGSSGNAPSSSDGTSTVHGPSSGNEPSSSGTSNDDGPSTIERPQTPPPPYSPPHSPQYSRPIDTEDYGLDYWGLGEAADEDDDPEELYTTPREEMDREIWRLVRRHERPGAWHTGNPHISLYSRAQVTLYERWAHRQFGRRRHRVSTGVAPEAGASEAVVQQDVVQQTVVQPGANLRIEDIIPEPSSERNVASENSRPAEIPHEPTDPPTEGTEEELGRAKAVKGWHEMGGSVASGPSLDPFESSSSSQNADETRLDDITEHIESIGPPLIGSGNPGASQSAEHGKGAFAVDWEGLSNREAKNTVVNIRPDTPSPPRDDVIRFIANTSEALKNEGISKREVTEAYSRILSKAWKIYRDLGHPRTYDQVAEGIQSMDPQDFAEAAGADDEQILDQISLAVLVLGPNTQDRVEMIARDTVNTEEHVASIMGRLRDPVLCARYEGMSDDALRRTFLSEMDQPMAYPIPDNSDIRNREVDRDVKQAISDLTAGSSTTTPSAIATATGRRSVSQTVNKARQQTLDDPNTTRGRANLAAHRRMVSRTEEAWGRSRRLSTVVESCRQRGMLRPSEPTDNKSGERGGQEESGTDQSVVSAVGKPGDSKGSVSGLCEADQNIPPQASPRVAGLALRVVAPDAAQMDDKPRRGSLDDAISPTTTRTQGIQRQPAEQIAPTDNENTAPPVPAFSNADPFAARPPSYDGTAEAMAGGDWPRRRASAESGSEDVATASRGERTEQSEEMGAMGETGEMGEMEGGGSAQRPEKEKRDSGAAQRQPASDVGPSNPRRSRFCRARQKAKPQKGADAPPVPTADAPPPPTPPRTPKPALTRPVKIHQCAAASAPRPTATAPDISPAPASMNNFPFLDSPTSGMANPLPRQPPTPGSAHQSNGSGGMPNLVNGLLSGGQQTDMNHLWQVVQQLSDVLAENRNQTATIMNSVQQIQARAAQDGASPTIAQVNGDLNAATSRQNAAEIHALRTQLQSAHTSLSSFDTQNAALRSLLQDYETGLTVVLDKLRPYAHQHHDAIVALHAHYNTLLEKERQTNLELRLEHQEWQQGLSRVAQYARAALKESADGNLGYERKVRELKAENRVLRRLAGWEEASDSDEDERREDEGLPH